MYGNYFIYGGLTVTAIKMKSIGQSAFHLRYCAMNANEISETLIHAAFIAITMLPPFTNVNKPDDV